MFSRVLVLSPHTDDGELGCGGTIAKFAEKGREIFYVALSSCEKSVPSEFPPDILRREVRRATRVLGIDSENLLLYDFPVREFPDYRQDILETLIELRERLSPSAVLVPSLRDLHQDHRTVAEEALRAFRQCTILGYEQPWNSITFNTSAFVPLGKGHVERKIEALKCYESQRHRNYLTPDFIWSLARTRGTQIGEEYAEVFEVIRWVLRD
ncbi:MAG: PIG-L family deacetylase [Euryarchaeota archaeon]|nr:PIG-L family deacetylase [Euryarchaeota archaeon]